MKKKFNIFLIIILTLNISLFSENIFANLQIKENPVENNYNFTSYFKSIDDLYKYRKSIVIDTKIGNIKAFYYGQEIWSFDASVGNRLWPTPHGKFRIVNKHPMMQAKTSGLYMPNWMEFRGNGTYGIHGFPLYKDFTPKYPNEEKFSRTQLGGGCVRLEKANINALYNWAELLTTVIVL